MSPRKTLERFSTQASDVFSADHDGLVFNPQTGETHYLPPASWLVFEALHRSPRTFDEIVAILRAALDPCEGEDVGDLAKRYLDELRSLWLVTSDDGSDVPCR